MNKDTKRIKELEEELTRLRAFVIILGHKNVLDEGLNIDYLHQQLGYMIENERREHIGDMLRNRKLTENALAHQEFREWQKRMEEKLKYEEYQRDYGKKGIR